MKFLCVGRVTLRNDFLSTPQSWGEDIVLLCIRHEQHFPALQGTRAPIRTHFTKVLTGQECHTQKHSDCFLSQIRISFCSIHSQGAHFLSQFGQFQKNKLNLKKAMRAGGRRSGAGVGGVVCVERPAGYTLIRKEKKEKSKRMDDNRKAYLCLNKGTLVSKGLEQT